MSSGEHFAYLAWRRRMRLIAGGAAVVVVGTAVVALNATARRRWMASAPLPLLQQEAARNPGDLDLSFHVAYKLVQEGRAGEAYPTLQRLVKARPGSSTFWYGAARAASQQGLAEEAVRGFRQAIALDGSPAAHAALAQIYADAGLVTDAAAEYEQAVRRDPRVPVNRESWARCLAAQGRLQEAWRIAEAAAEASPMLDGAYLVLGEIGPRLGRSLDAEFLLRRRINMTMAYPVAELRRALVELLLKRPHTPELLAEAEDLMGWAVTDVDAENFALVARVRMLRGNLQGARQALRTGLEANPEHPECHRLMAEVLRRLGDRQGAARHEARVPRPAEPDPGVATLRKRASEPGAGAADHLRLAEALNRTGEPAEAAEACHRALRLIPSSREARALLERSRDEAIRHLQRLGRERAAREAAAGGPP